MAGWIKMPLGMEVGLCPGHIVLDGTQLPLPKGAQSTNFRPMSVVAKRLPISATVEHLLTGSTRMPASADRTARCQFQATGQPVS